MPCSFYGAFQGIYLLVCLSVRTSGHLIWVREMLGKIEIPSQIYLLSTMSLESESAVSLSSVVMPVHVRLLPKYRFPRALSRRLSNMLARIAATVDDFTNSIVEEQSELREGERMGGKMRLVAEVIPPPRRRHENWLPHHGRIIVGMRILSFLLLP